jgi:tetratricopeptide (TPR) repeat protein
LWNGLDLEFGGMSNSLVLLWMLSAAAQDPTTSAVALNNQGAALAARHEFERALPVLRRALAVASTALSAEDYAQVAGNTAQVYIRLGDFAAAEPLVDMANAKCGAGYLSYAILLRAEVRIGKRDWIRAHTDLDRAFLLIARDSPLLAGAHHLRAVAWHRSGNHKSAVREFALAVEHSRHLPDWSSSLDTLELLSEYGAALRKAGARSLRRAIAKEKQGLQNLHHPDRNL